MTKMQLFKAFATALCLLMVCGFAAPRAKAQLWNKKTTVTFSVPVEVPGVGAQVLPAGTYVFKLADVGSSRNIVQIFSADELHVYTTILAINNYRLQPTDKTVMTFRERAEGQPEAIRAWFYPGDNYGQQFVYPKARAVELAKQTNEPVLATPIEPATAPIEALQTAPVIAIKPSGEIMEMVEVVQSEPPVETASAESLPHTASPLPVILLAGLLALGAGFAARFASRRTA